jgi:hypothetical protein
MEDVRVDRKLDRSVDKR